MSEAVASVALHLGGASPGRMVTCTGTAGLVSYKLSYVKWLAQVKSDVDSDLLQDEFKEFWEDGTLEVNLIMKHIVYELLWLCSTGGINVCDIWVLFAQGFHLGDDMEVDG